jgi:hypothetical protein
VDTLRPWLETVGVVLLAVLGALAGRFFSRLKKPYWVLGYALPLAAILLVGTARRWVELSFTAPISWIVAGRSQFIVIALASTTLLVTPLSRLPRKRDRTYVILFLLIFLVYSAVCPVLLPALMKRHHESLVTLLDEDGICRQHDSYTCGPAAAVTALRRLGFPAEVGDLAIRALTTPVTGTPPDLLCAALDERYGREGLTSTYKIFKGVNDLPAGACTLAMVKLTFLLDHHVTVLSVSDKTVVVGDPLHGRREMSHDDFRKIWRGTGIVLRRN